MYFEKTKAELSHYGKSMALILFGLALFSAYRHPELRPGFYLCVGLATAFLSAAIVVPESLRSVEKFWMALGEKLGFFGSIVVMLLTFIFVLTPIALLLRILRKDLLNMRLDKQARSYWLVVEKDGAEARYYLPY